MDIKLLTLGVLPNAYILNSAKYMKLLTVFIFFRIMLANSVSIIKSLRTALNFFFKYAFYIYRDNIFSISFVSHMTFF